MRLTKRLLAMLLTVVMVLSMLPAIALTASAATPDSLSVSDFAATGTSYTATSAFSKPSGAKYAGKTAKGNNAIQINATSGNGVWVDTSVGNLASISVTWNSNSASGRTLNIYAANTKVSTTSGGTKVGSIVCGTSTSYTFTGNYSYFYVVSSKSALYLDGISVEWASSKTLSSIALSGSYTTTFPQNGTFNHTGMVVTATYSDSSTENVTSSATWSSPDMSTAGTKTVTVSYTEGGTTKTATYSITVSAPTPAGTLTLTEAGTTRTTVSSGYNVGDTYTLPSTATNYPTDTSYNTFIGWYNGSYSHASTAPSGANFYAPGAAYTMTSSAVTLKAVYAKRTSSGGSAGYALTTEAPADGDTIVIAGLNNGTYYALSHTVGNSITGEELTISNGVATNASSYLWKVDSKENGDCLALKKDDETGTNYLKFNSAKFAYNGYGSGTSTSNTAGMEFVASGEGFQMLAKYNTRSVTFSGTTFSVVNNQSSPSTVYIFKYSSGGATTTTNYQTDFATLSSIALSGTYPTTFTQGDAFSHTGMVVTATYSDNSHTDVTNDATWSSPDMSTTGNKQVTVSYGGQTATYQITVSAPVYTFTAASNNTNRGTVATDGSVITATPTSGNRVSTSTPYTVSPSGAATVTQNGNEFTVSGLTQNCTVTINFEAIPTYAVTITQPASGGTIGVNNGGSSVSSGASVQEGATLTLTNTPASGYVFGEWSVYKTGDTSTTVTVTNNTFTMPSYAVTVTASFTQRYTLVDLANETLNDGDEVILYFPSGGSALGDTANGSVLNAVAVTPSNNTLEAAAGVAVMNVIETENGLRFQLKSDTSKYLAYTGNGGTNYIGFAEFATLDDTSLWTLNANGNYGYNLTNVDTNTRAMQYYSDKITAYTGFPGQAFQVNVYRIPAPTYTITAQSNNNSYGTVALDNRTITATPATGYRVSTTTPYEVVSGTATVTNNGDNTFTVRAQSDCTIRINFEAIPTYNVTYSNPTGGTITVQNSGANVASGTSVQEGTVLTLTATPSTGYTFGSWSVTGATPADGNATTTTITVTAATSISATFNAKTQYTLTYSANGATTTESPSPYGGDTVTLPASNAVTPPTGYTFVGWLPSTYETSNTAPSGLLDPGSIYTMPNENTTLYAVYALGGGTNWEKTDLANIPDGKQLVIVGVVNGSRYSMSNSNGASSAPAAAGINVTGTHLTNTPGSTIIWTLEKDVTNYSFKTGESSYLYCNNDNNGLRVGSSGDNKVFVIDSGYLKNSGQNRYVGVYNSANWRSYTSINSNIENQTFEYYMEPDSYAGYTTSPVLAHSVTAAVSPAETGTVSLGAASVGEGSTTTATANPAAHYHFDHWTISGTGASLSDTTENPTTITMGTADVTVTAYFVADTQYTLTYSVNGNTSAIAAVTDYADEQITLPASNAVTPPAGYTFMGWLPGTYATDDTAPTGMLNPGTNYTMPAVNTTLYAVFAIAGESSGGGDYELVTSAPNSWEGEYLIANTSGSTAYVMAGPATGALDSANTYGLRADVSTYYDSSENTIASNSTTDAYAYTFAAVTNGYSLYGPASSAGFVAFTGTSNNNIKWVSTFDSDKCVFTPAVGALASYNCSDRAIRYNGSSGQERFSNYGTSGVNAISLFKKTGGVTYSGYTTAVQLNLIANDDTIVIDWALPVTFNVLTNDEIDVAYTMTVGTLPSSVVNNGEGSFTYTPSGMQQNNLTFTYTLTGNTGSGETSDQATVTLKVADTVYYEETTAGIFTYEGEWQNVSDGSPVSSLTDIPSDISGYEAAYASYSTYSGGTAKKATVPQSTSPSVTFTFAGTGFDVISATTVTSGTIMVTVKDSGGAYATYPGGGKVNQIIDTYRGYSYSDGAWTPSHNASANYYQIPIIRATGLTYGTYTVEVKLIYSSSANHTGNDSYDFFFDGVRIYNPVSGQAAEYKYLSIRDAVAAGGTGSGTVTGHSFGAWLHNENSSPSSHTRTCTDDGCSETETALCSFTSAVTTQPTGNTAGVRTYTCSGCGYSYTESIPATGYTVTYYVNGGQYGTETVTEGNSPSFTAPSTDVSEFNAHRYEFAGWKEGNALAQDVNTAPTTYTSATASDYTVTGNVTMHAVYTYTTTSSGTGTPIGSLANGASASYVIAGLHNSKYYAIPNNFTNNSRPVAEEITGVSNGTISASDASGYTFTITHNSGSSYTIAGIGAVTGETYLSTTGTAWTITTDGTNGSWNVASETVSGKSLLYRSDNNIFGGYATSNLGSNATNYHNLEIIAVSGTSSNVSMYATNLQSAGSITHTYVASIAPSTLSMTVYDEQVVAGTLTDNSEITTAYTPVYSTSNSSIASVDSETGQVVGVAVGNATITVTYYDGSNNELAHADCTVSVSAALTTYTVTYYVNGTVSRTEQIASGGSASLTAPSATFNQAGGYEQNYTFLGWKVGSGYALSTTNPGTLYGGTSGNSTYTVSTDTALYAIYTYGSGGASYELITSSPTGGFAGDYIFVGVQGSTYYAMNPSLNGGSNDAGTIGNASSPVNITSLLNSNKDEINGSISGDYVLTIAASGDYYTLADKDGSYLGHYGTNKYYSKADSASTDNYKWSISVSASGANISNKTTNYNALFNTNNTTAFRPYLGKVNGTTFTSGYSAYLYKSSGSGGNSTNYYTSSLVYGNGDPSLSVSPGSLALNTGGYAELTVTAVNGSEGSYVTATTSNSSVATVTPLNDGADTLGVSAHGTGNATITVYYKSSDGTSNEATPVTISVSVTATSQGNTGATDENYGRVGNDGNAPTTSGYQNAGTRGVTATSISTTGKNWYSGKSVSWTTLKALSGNNQTSSVTAASNNDLLEELSDLMHISSSAVPTYSGTVSGTLAYYWIGTDKSANGSTFRLIYSDVDSGSNTNGSYFNREHVWPQSLGHFTTSGAGADLHHLRPEYPNINSSRGNHPFGDVTKASANTYNYGGRTVLWVQGGYAEVMDNVKGDVARILLYVYTAYPENKNIFTTDGSYSQVMRNRDTLLEWMQIDPVDTWEMSRNDAIQSVQGNRNVYIDYPELAWMIFGLQPPTNMTTPSGKAAANDCGTRTSYTNPLLTSAVGTEYAVMGEEPVAPATRGATRSIEPGSVPTNAAIMIDGLGQTNVAADIEAYGPKFGIYLAPSQGIVFTLQSADTTIETLALQLGAKAVNGAAGQIDVAAIGSASGNTAGFQYLMENQAITSATEMYYALDGDNLSWESGTSSVIVIYNSGSDVVAITNLRYPATNTLTMSISNSQVQRAVRMIREVYGLPETDPDPINDAPELDFRSASLALNSDIAINFYVDAAVYESIDAPYAVFTKALYNASGEVTGYATTTVSAATLTDNGYCFSFIGIRPDEMGSAVTAKLYGYRDGTLVEGDTCSYSVLSYVNRMANSSYANNADFRTLLADLVSYGAAAQTYTGYNTANLATAGVSADLMTNATAAAPSLTNRTAFAPNGNESVSFVGAYLTLRDKVTVCYTIDAGDYDADALELLISYTDYDGTPKTVTISGEDFTEANGLYVASFSELNAVQMRTVLSAEVFANGSCVSSTLTYSIESYAQSKASGGDALAALVNAMMKFGDSAMTYFAEEA